MQRETRMKRELKMMENDPSPGISCWMIEDRIDYLQASKLLNQTVLSISLVFNSMAFRKFYI